MKLEEFFKKIGFDISGIIGEYSQTDKYLSWYKGFVDSFHKYYVYNGERQVFKKRYSLSIPKKVCESFADFLMNERVKITLGKDENTEVINDILQINNFWVKANQGIEKTFALGTGCFLLSLDRQKGIKIQFINAGNIQRLLHM
jgi:A118 family predicted phage portal protein